jgi:hypothetical protein
MKELVESERILIICFWAAVETGLRWHYEDTIYDPRDFSYWGA